MNPIIFALRHPWTVMVGMVAIAVGSILAMRGMPRDIFPNLNLPVVYVCQPYGGMDPAQMEGLLTYYYEYHFLYISGIHHVESKNIQSTALMKLVFHPGTDMAQAMAETIAYVNRSRAFMPPNTVPPFVMRFDTGSVPVGYLVLSSETKTIGEIQDQALNKVRPMFASIAGVSAPPPFGGSQRTILINADPDRMRAYNLSPDDVVNALVTGNTISPSGNIRIGDKMPMVPVNAMVVNPKDLGNIPVRPGDNVYIRDLGYPGGSPPVVEDGSDITTGYSLVNGRRAVYILVTKRADASTLAVVKEVKANLEKMQAVLPGDIKVSFEFDQSPYVTRAIWGVGLEALLGAFLTGVMVLLFLRDWRSVIVVVLNIPLALLGAIIALWLTGQTINLMTLGGLALAVGILVDEATVEVENIHTQMSVTGSIARAVRLGNAETAVPRLLAMLCILAVFIPSFFMEGAARNLFVPLALAVGFAMVTSYFLSSTFVPVLSVWLLRHYHPQTTTTAGRFSFARLVEQYTRIVQWAVKSRWLLLPAYGVGAALLIWLIGGSLGREIFPTVDAGQFQLRLRAAPGTRIERTEEIVIKALDFIKEEVGEDQVAISVGYVGVVPPSYPINAVYLWMGGPEEAVLRVALKSGSGIRIEKLKSRLREVLPNRLKDWLDKQMTTEGFSPGEISKHLAQLRFSFEPADIVNEVMSFGSPTPIEVVVSGPKFADNRDFAEKIRQELSQVPSLRDLQIVQSLEYPTIEVTVDRERAGQSGITAQDLAKSLVAATSSSRFVVPNYWRDPKSGIGYQVQVQIPTARMNAAGEVGLIPVKPNGQGNILVRDVARVQEGTMPGQWDRYNMRRLVSLTANIEGEDLGRVSRRLQATLEQAKVLTLTDKALASLRSEGVPESILVKLKPLEDRKFKSKGPLLRELKDILDKEELEKYKDQVVNNAQPPALELRGQVVPMQEMFYGLTIGLVMAVVVIFLLLTAYFQSPMLALVVLSTVPAVIVGVVLALWITGTTLNIQSFMGAIMALGVANANAILLVTFAERSRRAGSDSATAAVDGAKHRLRPILMTSFAMIAGMAPLALALGEGGEQVAPLGRAVIGGLALATLTTLLILPAVFAVGKRLGSTQSPSLDPDDPDSAYCDQPLSAAQASGGH